MALPTFLSAAQLLVLQERVTKARNEVNVIAAELRAASELNLLRDIEKASGKLWSAHSELGRVAQRRIAGGN